MVREVYVSVMTLAFRRFGPHRRTTAPSPNSFFIAMGEINSEALRSDARDPAAA